MDEPTETKEQEESALVVASPPQAAVLPSPEPQRPQQQEQAAPKHQRLADRLAGFSSVFEALVAVSAIVGVVLIVYQVSYMGESNELTRRSVEATERALKLTEESNRLTRDGLQESKRQAEASFAQSRADAEASQRLTRDSLAESRKALEITQRARLTVDRYEFSTAEDGSIIAVAVIKNTGFLAATEVRWFASAKIYGTSNEFVTHPIDPYMDMPMIVLGSGVSFRVEVVRSPAPADPIWGGFVYFSGRVHYTDGFGHDRALGFCQYYGVDKIDPPNWDWRPCYNHNWADEEPEILRRYREYLLAHPEEATQPRPERQ